MRPFLSLSLVVLLLLNLFGFYIAYCVRLEGVHEEMAEALRSSQPLQVIALNNAEYKKIEWTAPGRECRINGNLYDVSKTEITASGIRLYLRIDEDETSLDDSYVQNFQSEPEIPGSPVKLIMNLIGQDFIVAKNKTLPSPVLLSGIFRGCISNTPLTEFIMEKISPPPWC